MAGWWLCSVMTSYISVRMHGCCQRNRPLRTKHGACRRISFPAACLSECAQTCPSDRRNHLAAFRSLQLFLRRHSAVGSGPQLRTDGAGRWAGPRFDAPFYRCIWLDQVPLGGRRACARVVVGDARARTFLTCFRLFWE